MSVTSAIVLFATVWAVTFFCVLPFGQVSQHEAGDVEPGTPASAPTDAQIKRKLLITTGVSIVVFAIVYYVLAFGVVTLDDIPWFTPPSAR
jgi:predicted secreted protein